MFAGYYWSSVCALKNTNSLPEQPTVAEVTQLRKPCPLQDQQQSWAKQGEGQGRGKKNRKESTGEKLEGEKSSTYSATCPFDSWGQAR